MAAMFRWRPGSRFSVKAQVAGGELDRIRRENNGDLIPASVVDAARDDESPLHDLFEWEDSRAAELFRQTQARHLINSIRIIVREDEESPEESRIAFIRVRVDKRSSYRSASSVLSDTDLRKQAIDECLALLEGVKARFDHLNELAEVFEAIQNVSSKFRTKKKRRLAKV